MPHPPFIILDEQSDEPLYRQIYETIRRSILSGEFLPGKKLPSSRYLAKQLNVARMTILNAYDQLMAEGYLEIKAATGTYVAEHLPEEFLNAPRLKLTKSEADLTPRKLTLSDYGKNFARESRRIMQSNQATPLIPFQYGLTAVDEFPFDIWTKLANKSYRRLEKDVFGYGERAGFYPLREAIAAHLKSVRAVNCTPEQVIITGGTQQAFDLIGRIFLDAGAEVLVENPCYLGAKQAFRFFGAKFIPIEVDNDGLNVASAAEKGSHTRLAYVTPSHQFPLGVTMSLARRLALIEWARANDAWIVEDDYDSEFRYAGRPQPSLQGLDRHGRVLYVGTFSKTIFPALKLGCLVVPPDLAEIFTSVCALSGRQSSLIDQATLAEFISEGHFARHVRRMRGLYGRRQEILISEIKKYLGGLLEAEKQSTGMHLIGWLPEGISDTFAAEKAAESGVKTAALSAHSLTEQVRGGLILGYAALDEKQIKAGVKKLARILEEFARF